MENKSIPISKIEQFMPETIGQDVLRYICLPDLLGTEKDSLLYFAGKNLARHIELKTIDDLYYIFNKLNWGQLELIKDRKKRMTFHLMADAVAHRIQSPIATDFRLEAGFISEAIQLLTRRTCECFEKTNEKLYRIEFTVIFTD